MKSLSLVFVPAVLLFTACGGSSSSSAIGDKQGAASAAYRLQKTNEAVKARGGQGLRSSEVSADQTFTVQGQQGTAEVTVKADVGTGDVQSEVTIKYTHFSEDGANVLDGTVTQRDSVATGPGTADVSTSQQGTIDVSGGLAAHLVLDVSTSVSVSGAAASVKVNGRIVADGTTYTYSGDTFDLADQTL